MDNLQQISNLSLWSGRVLKILLLLFVIFDAVMKIIKHHKYVEGTVAFGLPESSVQPLGLYLLFSALLFAYPKTMIAGGLLLTAYLGGAMAITFAMKHEGHPYLFPIVFCILIWVSEYLQNGNIRNILPFVK